MSSDFALLLLRSSIERDCASSYGLITKGMSRDSNYFFDDQIHIYSLTLASGFRLSLLLMQTSGLPLAFPVTLFSQSQASDQRLHFFSGFMGLFTLQSKIRPN